jgi:hypothetical protein
MTDLYIAAVKGSGARSEVDPHLGGTQTWKLSHRRFIKREKKERRKREKIFYMCIFQVYHTIISLSRKNLLSVLRVF